MKIEEIRNLEKEILRLCHVRSLAEDQNDIRNIDREIDSKTSRLCSVQPNEIIYQIKKNQHK